MRYPSEHRTDTRRRIVDTASKAFRRHGATGVSVSQIMAEAGLTADIYLTPAHQDLHESGCPLPALTAEVGRRGNSARQSFSRSLQLLAEEIGARIDPRSPETGRGRTLGFLSTLVGSLLLARGVADDDLSQEILHAGRGSRVRRELPLATNVLLTPGM